MKTLKLGLWILITLIGMFALLNFLFPLDTHRLHKPKSTLIYDRHGQLLTVKLSSEGYLRIPLAPEEIRPEIQQIVLGYEDQYFGQHFGINPLAILRALFFNLTHQETIGASTITMQVARMMHHKPRTLSQKLIEMFQALQLELSYSKEEILTLYLNNAPYGGNVEGFASAAFKYFNRPVTSLSLSQIAYLTSIPKNPNANRPKPSRDINAIKNRLLDRLHRLHLLDNQAYHRAKAETIRTDIRSLPNRIPHLATYIQQEGNIHTSIDIALQESVQELIQQQAQALKSYGMHNGAAIVIDNTTMQILSYVGSNDFDDQRYGGQNDGLASLISPGSTLKPLIYARALEQGIITPLKKLFDVPLFIEGYQPTNYAKEYLGEVTATEALQLSLNIPAVELDRLLGEQSLYALLSDLNISSLRHPKHYYGSALTLGGWGLSLRDNAELFAMLANQGRFQRASYLMDHNYPATQQLLPEATYLISDILANAPRSEFSSSWDFIRDMPKVAFKTGTSAHTKDILTLGYTPHYTVGVWFGNFTGKASQKHRNRYITGLQGASPTLFKIFKRLNDTSWFAPPHGIVSQSICQDAIARDSCHHEVTDRLIKDVTPHTPCSAMRAEVLRYLIDQGTINSIADLSQHACYPEWQHYNPLITSPLHQQRYTYNRLLPRELKKTMLQCYSFETNSTVHWLINQTPPIRSTSGERLYLYLPSGEHTITCLDEGAKKQSITITTDNI